MTSASERAGVEAAVEYAEIMCLIYMSIERHCTSGREKLQRWLAIALIMDGRDEDTSTIISCVQEHQTCITKARADSR